MKVKITEIIVDKDRGRKDFGKIDELADSIKRHGLLHPLVVQQAADWKHVKLIAGERRLRACIFAGLSEVEVTLKEDTDDITRKEMELEENVVREDLTWPERCETVRQLDELKRKKYGAATQSRASEGWGIKETAACLGCSVGVVSEDIKLAKQIKANPAILKKVGHLPKHAARRVIKQEEQALALRKKVDNKELTISADLMLGKCEELIDTLEDESVSMLLTDPPFGIADISSVGASGHKAMTYNITTSNVATEDSMRACYKKLLPKLYKKMKPGAHIYMFFAHGWYCELIKMLRANGFLIGDVPIIWHKRRTSIVGKCKYYTPSFESILFGHRLPYTRPLKKPIADVFSISAVSPQKKVHPLQKPDALIRAFIEQSTDVGELVLDCFCGSAQTLVTAKKLQRRAVGFELDEGNFLKAQAYLNEENAKLEEMKC